MKRKGELALDKKDLQLLYLLDVDGRASYSELAKKTNMSKQRALYRVQRLESEGFIKGYYALIDTSRLGYTTFRIYLKLRTIAAKERKAMLDKLASIPQVWALYTFAGRYDLALGIAVKTHAQFQNIWENILADYLPVIKDYHISIYSPVYHYTKAYIIGKPDDKPARVLGGSEPVTYDEQDWKLLSALAANARSSLIELAANVKLTPEAVSHRLKELERKGIIQGYRAMIDVHKLGYQYFKADIRLREYKHIASIQAYCQQHPNIYQFDKTIGGETLEIEFNVKELKDMLAIISDMEEKFPGVMESFEYLTIVEELKTTYLPTI